MKRAKTPQLAVALTAVMRIAGSATPALGAEGSTSASSSAIREPSIMSQQAQRSEA